MMGSGAVLPQPTSGGLAELAAFVEMARDPARYQSMLAELAEKTNALEQREERVKGREEVLKKSEKNLQLRELGMLQRLQEAADARAQDTVKYTLRQADDRLAEVNALMADVNGVLARLAKVVAISDDLKTTVEKARRNMGAEAA